MFRVGIITASDSGFAGKREDVSGAVIKEIAAANGYQVTSYTMLPDDRKILAEEMKRLCDDDVADLVLTTGGTGFSPRDCTPEATLDIAERQAQGIAEAMRYSSMKITKRAMLSRAVAVIRDKTLIINLPGSPKAVRENLEFIITELPHGLAVLKGTVSNCAEK